ncbi:MAG: cobalamin biosynthesis protein CbiG [Gammaproteobacteria bacterium]|nr:cobalamin biosynthesis protein CbiG [Gammaproteobacteria bacterium]
MNSPTNPRVVIVAITRHGVKLAARLAQDLPEAELLIAEKFAAETPTLTNTKRFYVGALRDEIAVLFAQFDQIIFLVSLGAVVRLTAPHLRNKDVDPGITVVDDAGEFAIPVLSGHVGGANAYAQRVADILGARAVVTTASDVGKTIPVDILGRELDWKVEAPKINITRVSAHVVNGELIAFVQEHGARQWWTRTTALPPNIHLFDDINAVDLNKFRAVLWVTRRVIDSEWWLRLPERLVVYRPPLGQDK